MTFREWFINESAMSRAEVLYQQFINSEIELEELETIITKVVQKWYDHNEYDFDYDAFETEVLNKIKFADGESVKDILINTSKEMQQINRIKQIKHGIRIKDEEEGEKHDRTAKILTAKLEPVPKPVLQPEPEFVPIPEPVSKKIKRPWQSKFDFLPPDMQRKLF